MQHVRYQPKISKICHKLYWLRNVALFWNYISMDDQGFHLMLAKRVKTPWRLYLGKRVTQAALLMWIFWKNISSVVLCYYSYSYDHGNPNMDAAWESLLKESLSRNSPKLLEINTRTELQPVERSFEWVRWRSAHEKFPSREQQRRLMIWFPISTNCTSCKRWRRTYYCTKRSQSAAGKRPQNPFQMLHRWRSS